MLPVKIAGLRDFPRAILITSQTAYADILPRRGLNALRRGYIPDIGDYQVVQEKPGQLHIYLLLSSSASSSFAIVKQAVLESVKNNDSTL